MKHLSLEQLANRTEHFIFLTAEEYVNWKGHLSSIGEFLERQATQDLSSLIGEILTDCIDIAATGNETQRRRALLALSENVPDGRSFLGAPHPVRLVAYVFGMVMEFRGRHRMLWAMSHAPALNLTGVDINTVQFYPLPHGLIVCRRHAGSHQLRNIAAIGNYLISDDARKGIMDNTNLSVVATRITVEHALMSLLESWRLGHGRARRYLCDTAKGYLAHTKIQDGKLAG